MWSLKLLALAPGAERSRCGLVGSPGAPEAVRTECRRFRRPKSVSELTTCPRLGEDCWSRGLQSAVLLLVLRRGVSHRWLLPVFVTAASPLHKGLGNRDLHALPWGPIESRVGCLGIKPDEGGATRDPCSYCILNTRITVPHGWGDKLCRCSGQLQRAMPDLVG